MLDSIDTELECIKNYLQKNVTFCVDQKTVRRGRLLLYNTKDYYVRFIIKTNKDIQKTYEVPFPYKIFANKGYMSFSYKIQDLCADNDNKIDFIYTHFKEINNKLHDKRLSISIIEP